MYALKWKWKSYSNIAADNTEKITAEFSRQPEIKVQALKLAEITAAGMSRS